MKETQEERWARKDQERAIHEANQRRKKAAWQREWVNELTPLIGRREALVLLDWMERERYTFARYNPCLPWTADEPPS